ncbi:MAG: protein TolQ [Gammaproteobacteria bacterium]|nr:MAG: protein TolQ [Gammaproteobacteria bacterium]RLA16016.1 MAG: protein TolQ [Gammaproteobacteria bacterium]RLA16418.1 MAG: protein TolQ [Gammaproteobacteria bacterium]
MHTDLSIGAMILGASGFVQAIMLVLVLASVFSWAVIVKRYRDYQSLETDNQFFEKRFWSGVELEQLFRTLEKDLPIPGSIEGVFQNGYRQFRHLYDQPELTVEAALESAERGMRAAYNRQLDVIGSNLTVLATIGSTSPYVGLLGTVWGIMSAFQGLAGAQQATLAMVAPGIAEALVATAMGLLAAIPAVVAYNRFSQWVEQFASSYDAFIDDFMALLLRQGSSLRADMAAAADSAVE